MLSKVFLVVTLLFWGVTWSYPYPSSNRPEILNPLIDRFVLEARERGFDVGPQLKNLKSVTFIKQPLFNGIPSDAVTWSRGDSHRIEIIESSIKNSGFLLRITFHELGHVFGLENCSICFYNIMRSATSERANFLFKDEKISEVYFDIYFDGLRDPDHYNKTHKHR